MKLDIDQIIQIIKTECPEHIKKAKKKQVVLDVHINGNNVDKYLKQIEGHENQTQYELRKKLATSNKYLFANLLRPVDKVFSARGGSKTFSIEGEKSEELFKEQIQDVRYGMGARKYLQMVQANKYYSDPAGIMLFEISKDGKKTYPTLKSIQSIRNYHAEGRKLEWVLFEPYKKVNEQGVESSEEYFRLIDDANDYLFVKDGEDVKLLEDETYENPWGEVPAIVNSDQISSDLTYSDSPVDVVVELADKYLRTNTIKNIHEFLHGFPFFWMYQKKCDSCKGTGEVNGGICKSCGGSGASLKRDVSDVTLLKTPTHKDAPTIAPNVAGYVVPPLDIPKEQREELGWLWQMMHFSIWGTSFEAQDNETATGRFLDVQPVNDKLGEFSDCFEYTEKRMYDLIGKFYLADNYKGAFVNYGRRYMMESPDAIWKKYIDAKSNKAPKTSLNHLLNQYYQSEFMNDLEMLNIMSKGMKLEPFVHDAVEEIKDYITDDEVFKKVYFSEWWENLDENFILVSSLEVLTKNFNDYVQEKEKPAESRQEIN